jgi:two-component sensor histidine kinase
MILALALLPLLIFAVWRSYTDFSRDQVLLRNNADLTAKIALAKISHDYDITQSVLRFASKAPAGFDCESDLRRLTDAYPRVQNIFKIDKIGNVSCAANPVSSTGDELTGLLSGLSEISPFGAGVYHLLNSEKNPEPFMASAYGTFEGGALSQAFVIVEDIDVLLQSLTDFELSEVKDVAIFNESGEKLAGDWPVEDLQSRVQTLPLQTLTTQLSITDPLGRSILILPTPANDIYLGIASRQNTPMTSENFNPVAYAAMPILAWLFGFVAIWLSTDQLILTHIGRMRYATLKFAKGDRSARVGTLKNPPASLHALGRNFDLMADRIVEREAIIKDSLDEKETLLREIHHRVKNNLQIIISLLNMQERKLTDEKGLVAIVETRSRINAIALVHRGLYESQDLRFINMQTFLDRLLPELSLALGFKDRGILVSNTADCHPMEADTAIPVALFIVEALTNSVKHGVSRGGSVAISLIQSGENITVSVSDTGQAERDDRPSKSGMGTKLMKGFARQLGGALTANSQSTGYETTLNFTRRDHKGAP